MNSCNFVGRIFDQKPTLTKENGANVVRFFVEVEESRKDASGVRKKIFTVLGFEAWDTGAEAICANCDVGDQIALETNARYDQDHEEIYFRVKTFKVFK